MDVSDALHALPCAECHSPMQWRGTRATWEGDYEITVIRFECQASGCQVAASVEYRRFIPVDIAKVQKP
jgi:hypothetical protein